MSSQLPQECDQLKANHMKCTNPAWIIVDGQAYCRLDFNWLVGRTPVADVEAKKLSLFHEWDAEDLKKILDTHRP